MAIDRTIAPELKEINKIELLDYEKWYLKNGIPVCSINAGSQDAVSIELIFKAGKWCQERPLVASVTNAMLKEGSRSYTSQEISEKIDYYGAFLQTETDKDYASINLFSLTKHLHKVLPVLKDIIQHPVFDEKELKTYLSKEKEKFRVNSEKNAHLARREFNSVIFGKNHPYGSPVNDNDFDTVKKTDALSFWKNNYSSQNCTIFLSGKITEPVKALLNEFFSFEWNIKEDVKPVAVHINPNSQTKHFIFREDALQSAIRIGRPFIKKNHPDFIKVQVLITILGGYFGSRLMTTIREDKGYTYGIGAFVLPLLHEGVFAISTEVGANVTSLVLTEIYNEIKKLREELVSEQELTLVKSYLMGEILKSVDGPFSIVERWKSMILYETDKNYFDSLITILTNITPEEIREMAIKYLQEKDLYEVVVGKK